MKAVDHVLMKIQQCTFQTHGAGKLSSTLQTCGPQGRPIALPTAVPAEPDEGMRCRVVVHWKLVRKYPISLMHVFHTLNTLMGLGCSNGKILTLASFCLFCRAAPRCAVPCRAAPRRLPCHGTARHGAARHGAARRGAARQNKQKDAKGNIPPLERPQPIRVLSVLKNVHQGYGLFPYDLKIPNTYSMVRFPNT